MKNDIFDVAIIGGGPAGMMAAGRAAEKGAKVVLLEKNSSLGRKLLITGGGRCNILNAEMDARKLVAKYGPKGKALFGSFARFGVEDTLNFFEKKGLPIKVEAEKRAFPASNKSSDVLKVLAGYLKKGKVEVRFNSQVVGITHEKNAITSFKLKSGKIVAKNYVVATGGKSHPETGSTGEGFIYLKELGHSVEDADAALVPVKIKEQWVKDLSGISFPRARISVYQSGVKQESREGKILFTHFGLSGPLVLNMSRNMAELFKYGQVDLHLDLYPELDISALDKKVLENLNKFPNKMIKNNLSEIVPPRMVGFLLKLSGIDQDKEVNLLKREERMKIVRQIKDFPLTVSGFLGADKAIVTSGGVSLKEIDFKTMKSKLFSNLFLAGDVLNFDRPSGGFSLQICWTTGFLAGENSVNF